MILLPFTRPYVQTSEAAVVKQHASNITKITQAAIQTIARLSVQGSALLAVSGRKCHRERNRQKLRGAIARNVTYVTKFGAFNKRYFNQ
jgi:hypothetical protein